MLIESQANAEEIKKHEEDHEMAEEEVTKLKIECMVVITEKGSIKKELNRIDNLYYKSQKDSKEQRIQYDLLVDDVSKLNKQNNQYRQLLMENEGNMKSLQGEIRNLQEKNITQKQTSLRYKQESK